MHGRLINRYLQLILLPWHDATAVVCCNQEASAAIVHAGTVFTRLKETKKAILYLKKNIYSAHFLLLRCCRSASLLALLYFKFQSTVPYNHPFFILGRIARLGDDLRLTVGAMCKPDRFQVIKITWA